MQAALLPTAIFWEFAAARDRDDQGRARTALEAGRSQPLATILKEMERRYLGWVIGIEPDEEGGRWTYEFKLLPPTHRIYELEMDAATGALLGSEGPAQERR